MSRMRLSRYAHAWYTYTWIRAKFSVLLLVPGPWHLQRTVANLGLWRKTEKEEVNRGNLLLETRTCDSGVRIDMDKGHFYTYFNFFLLRFFFLLCFTAVALSMFTVLSYLSCVTMSVRSC